MLNNQAENIKISKQGLYVPTAEKDSCGVGLMADLKNRPSYSILDSSLTMLENMEHRGACGCEENTGDGAGILTQIPHYLFQRLFENLESDLPAQGKYGVGLFFLPHDEKARNICISVIHEYANEFDFEVIHERKVPVDNSMLGNSAVQSEPEIVQYFFKTTGFNNKDLERRFYFLRSSIMKKVYFLNPDLVDDFYI